MHFNTITAHNRKKDAKTTCPCGIEIILCNKSALEYWRMHRNIKINDNLRLRRNGPPAVCPNQSDIYNMLPSGLTVPINIIIGNQRARRRSTIFQPRVYTGPTPDGCFINVGDGIAVSSPQFCFFQMASDLPLIKLIELGFELCGAYSLPVKDEPGLMDDGVFQSENGQDTETAGETTYNYPPLSSTKAINGFVTRMVDVGGQKNASRALRFIANGAASPMETKLVMLLTLPHRLGGFGLPMPELNKRIDPSKADRQGLRLSEKAYFKCDLFWKEKAIAVEYDSDLFHTNEKSIHADSERRFDLDVIGIDPITVTGKQVRDPVALERIARQIAKKLGIRWQHKSEKSLEAEYELRRLLMLL